MMPIEVPNEAKAGRPYLHVLNVGPPPGFSEAEVATVESLVGQIDGMPVYADYWKPSPFELDLLNSGGFIELIQYTPQMAMHSMAVWAGTADVEEDDEEDG